MTTVAMTAAEALEALAGVAAADPPPVDAQAAPGPAPGAVMAVFPTPAARSASQTLIDRFTTQTVRLQQIRHRLDAVLGVIDGRRVAQDAEAGTAKPRPTSYFEGLTLIADCKDSVLDGLDKTLAELEALF